MTKRLLVFGAGGATGRRVIAQARRQGHEVRASDRGFADDGAAPEGVERVAADVLSGDLRALVAGRDAVISCLGVPNDPATLLDPPPLYTDGTRRIAEAMAAEGVGRLVVISASFVAAPDRGPVLFRTAVVAALAQVLGQMREMEGMLRASGLDWTAVRPGWLLDDEASGDPWIGPDAIPPDLIRTRTGDLAALLLDCAATGSWSRATPAIVRREAAFRESSGEVLVEMLA